MQINLILAMTFNVVLLATCAFAFVRGGAPERIGAGLNLAASAITTGLRLIDASFFAPDEIVIFSIDLTVVAGFYWLAIKTTRFWPIWAFGFGLADIFMNLSGTAFPRAPLFVFHTSLGIYTYLALGALALGTVKLPRNSTPQQRWGFRP